MVTIGSLELGRKPRVAAVVDSMIPLQRLIDLKELGVDLLEIRADLIAEPLETIERYLFDITLALRLPLIGTVRNNDRTIGRREEYFRRILPFVDCVDVELTSPDAEEIRNLARAHEKDIRILVSEHDFEKTPSIDGLRAMAAHAIDQGADIIKIVTMARSADDAWRLITFAGTFEFPVVAFAMGEHGTFSRLRACEFGSLFTYGYITKAVAPGQLSAEELCRKLKPKEK